MWKLGPAPGLQAGDVHVWLARLDLPEEPVAQLRCILSPEEKTRADRFYFERDRRRFTVARGTLRSVLAPYLNQRREDIQFRYEPAGKPYLRMEDPPLHFNVSHSNELALIALSLVHRIGIDVEFKNRPGATLDIARNFFAPEEIEALTELPEEARCDAFFAIWTMKEAYIKGRGEGVSLGLDTFAVNIASDQPRGLIRSAHGKDEPARWRFWNIDAGPGYAAAMTVEGSGERRLSFWNATPARSPIIDTE